MTRLSQLLALTATVAVASAAVAGAAVAPVVGKQRTLSTTTAPVTIPGTGVAKGERLPRGARLVARDVTLADGQQARLTITAPTGKALRGLAPAAGQAVGFVVTSKADYVGRKRVGVRAFAGPDASDEPATARIYGLVH